MTALLAADVALYEYQQAQEQLKAVQESPEVIAYIELQAKVRECEAMVKEAVKSENLPRVSSRDYEAILTVRHSSPSVAWKIPELEAAFPWANACLVKAVDEKALFAVAAAKSVDLTLFQVVTPGMETKAVTIRPLANTFIPLEKVVYATGRER
jgi:hypothetical protein